MIELSEADRFVTDQLCEELDHYSSRLRLITLWQSSGAAMTRDNHILLLAWRRFKAIFLRLTGEWRPLLEPRVAPEQIATEMKAASFPTISFFTLLAFSCAIATFGLLANSAPAIIGAMIIAPLMTPTMDCHTASCRAVGRRSCARQSRYVLAWQL
jgi:hypothetical protein